MHLNHTHRLTIPAAEALIGQPAKVLDHGEVMLVDYLGGDRRIVDAARVAYGQGTKTVREDLALLMYLMANAHTSPFEQVILVFRMVLPLFIAAQIVRHRTARLNAESFRFSEASDKFYIPAHLRNQHATNKQAALDAPFVGAVCPQCKGEAVLVVQAGDMLPVPGPVPEDEVVCLACDQGRFTERLGIGHVSEACRIAYATYEAMLAGGVAREQARMILPQNLYTTWYWQVDLHNLFHFLRLRLDWHAQWEVRQYAGAMATSAFAVAPMAYQAFEEHQLFAERFSRTELAVLRRMLKYQLVAPERALTAACQAEGMEARKIDPFIGRVLGPDATAGGGLGGQP